MEYLTDNPQRRCPVISKARTELDYEPEIPLEAGIRRTMIWYNENRNAEEA
jgi:nucleoside-diphosphate-sugar epimerase